MLHTPLRLLERGRHVKDLLAVLDRGDAPAGETVAIAAAVDEVHDRRLEIAALEEIRVQRVRHAIGLDGRVGGLERLAQHLTAKHLRTADIAALTAKQIDLEPLEIHQSYQAREALGHHGTA